MPAKTNRTPARRPAPRDDVAAALRALERHASKRVREEMAPRYGIITKKAFGVPMAKIQLVAKQLGRDHELALALWETGWYEARLLASMVDDPAQVTSGQIDRWVRDFDNWAVVDTVCFKLFDRTPHVFAKIEKWAKARDEFVKRTGFALLACVALHTTGDDEDFLRSLPLIERGAEDDRNFVKKGVSWALRAIGGKRSPALRVAARELAKRLAESPSASARWIGRAASREFARSSARGRS
jgi:3-methyladenine DNA glycosylase AlkD